MPVMESSWAWDSRAKLARTGPEMRGLSSGAAQPWGCIHMTDIFSAHAAIYDASRRRLVPCFDSFYGAPARIFDGLGLRPRRALDIGAGTGLLSAIIARTHAPEALTLLDRSAAMLARAKGPLTGIPELYAVAAPMQALETALPRSARFDAVWSALAIHHLGAAEKRSLFVDVFERLSPGGVFLNADQALGETAEQERIYRAAWLRDAAAAGASAEEIALALERMKEDRMDRLSDQTVWLVAAGFRDVRVWFQDFSFNVITARRPK